MDRHPSTSDALETGGSVAALPGAAIIDWRQVSDLHSLGADDGFLSELIERFVADGTALIRSMKAAARQSDAARFRDQLHALKGAAGSIGASALYRECGRGISEDRTLSTSEMTAMIERVEDAFAAARAALTRFVNAPLRQVRIERR